MQSFTQKIRLKVSRLRQLIVESLLPRESHHIGCSLSILDIVTVLYYSILRTNPKKPSDPDRDIFILSKGHGALAVYAVLYEKGFFSKDILMSYDRDG
ncbi:transketolase, partial [Candidatus Roizmanbacteria bacterium CG_4_9_14_0_2_um_filter_39_13]